MMIVCRVLLFSSVILSSRSFGFRVNCKSGQALRCGSTYINLMLQSATEKALGTDVNSFLDALRFPSERMKVIVIYVI